MGGEFGHGFVFDNVGGEFVGVSGWFAGGGHGLFCVLPRASFALGVGELLSYPL